MSNFPVFAEEHIRRRISDAVSWLESTTPKLPGLRTAIIIPVAYFACAVFAIHLAGQAVNIASIWFANAVVLAALLRHPIATWPSLLFLQGVADLAASIFMGSTPVAALGVAFVDVLEVLAVASVLNRFGGSKPWYLSFRWMSLFALTSILASAGAALFGTSWLSLLGEAPFGETWKLWVVADALGLIIVTPFLLGWTESALRNDIGRDGLLEMVFLACLVGAAGLFVFSHGTVPLLFLVFPFLLVIAFRAGLLGATVGVVTLALIAMWFTLNGRGPIAELPQHLDSNERIQILQIYLLVALISTLPTAIILTQRTALTKRLGYVANHDLLTDLANRSLFHEKLSEALARTGRGHGFAILCLDLDRFKEVNDTLGHAAGDAILQQTAQRLRRAVREGHTVARLGGDEFAVIQTDLKKPEAAASLATRIVEAVGRPYRIGGKEVMIGTSVGIALAPADARDPDELLRRSDLALYRAKLNGRANYCFFDPAMDAELQARHAVETGLKSAVDNGEFFLEYQPVLDLQAQTICGFEALIRWRHPDRGVIAPENFISIAEDIGLIVPIGEWALKEACKDAAQWPDALHVSVNLSAIQFRSPHIVDSVSEALGLSNLPAERLELEVTETVLLEQTKANLAILHQLRAIGARLVMDDFGTGYSSLSYLRNFTFDKIKIDHCFVRDLSDREGSAAIVRATIQLAHTLGISTTAEGGRDA